MSASRDRKLLLPRQEPICPEGIPCPPRHTLDDDLYLALSLYTSSALAFRFHLVFVLFPILTLRPLSNGYRGGIAVATLSRRCTLLREGDIDSLVREAHEARTNKVAKALAEASALKSSFSKTAKATILAKARAVGRACKLAFSYGMESDPVLAPEFLSKLTLLQRHPHIPGYESKGGSRPNGIPLKSMTDAFSGMSKNSAAHKDGRTWKLLRDVARKLVTAALLRKSAEQFSNGALPKNMWVYFASVPMYPVHKKLPKEIEDPLKAIPASGHR